MMPEEGLFSRKFQGSKVLTLYVSKTPSGYIRRHTGIRREDCPGWTFERLKGEGFSDDVLAALDSVTKREGEPYEEFVLRATASAAAKPIIMRNGCKMYGAPPLSIIPA
jgi:hypothetical protein